MRRLRVCGQRTSFPPDYMRCDTIEHLLEAVERLSEEIGEQLRLSFGKRSGCYRRGHRAEM